LATLHDFFNDGLLCSLMVFREEIYVPVIMALPITLTHE
jgi:hypothetical protein